MTGNHEVFPASRASHLDGWFRRLLFRPGQLVDRYVWPGDTVLDIGCGPGLFTRAIARKVGDNGLVIAVDVQDRMLEILKEKAKKKDLSPASGFTRPDRNHWALKNRSASPLRLHFMWSTKSPMQPGSCRKFLPF